MQCNITFAKKTNLFGRERKFHPQDIEVMCNKICGVNKEKFRTIFDLLDERSTMK